VIPSGSDEQAPDGMVVHEVADVVTALQRATTAGVR
jgi:hypothetical protein